MSDSPPSSTRREEIQNHITKAEMTIEALCNGGRWTMSVPARLNEDPDLIFARVVGDAKTLLSENARLEAALAERDDAHREACNAYDAEARDHDQTKAELAMVSKYLVEYDGDSPHSTVSAHLYAILDTTQHKIESLIAEKSELRSSLSGAEERIKALEALDWKVIISTLDVALGRSVECWADGPDGKRYRATLDGIAAYFQSRIPASPSRESQP